MKVRVWTNFKVFLFASKSNLKGLIMLSHLFFFRCGVTSFEISNPHILPNKEYTLC